MAAGFTLHCKLDDFWFAKCSLNPVDFSEGQKKAVSAEDLRKLLAMVSAVDFVDFVGLQGSMAVWSSTFS